MSNTPTLPSAKPNRTTALSLLAVSGVLFISGLGLGGSAVALYMRRAEDRVDQTETIASLERDAQLRQTRARLKRNTDAPVWINDQVYQPGVEYQLEGVTKTEVPVLVGLELDTAICVGTMGPEGFKQNPDTTLCLGY